MRKQAYTLKKTRNSVKYLHSKKDLERRVPIDLLPDREAETFKKWLLAHPGVQIISRDRGGAFADGARQGAPQAQQVADWWQPLANLSETMKGFFLTKQAQLKALGHSPAEDLSEEEAKQLARLPNRHEEASGNKKPPTPSGARHTLQANP